MKTSSRFAICSFLFWGVEGGEGNGRLSCLFICLCSCNLYDSSRFYFPVGQGA